MEVKVYKRKAGHPADDLLAAIAKSTTLVKVDQADYCEALLFKLNFEDRIICGEEDILSNRDKVLGIIDIELFMANHLNRNLFVEGDLAEIPFGTFIKTSVGYIPAEIKNKKSSLQAY